MASTLIIIRRLLIIHVIEENDIGLSYMLITRATLLGEILVHWQKTFSLWPWADNLLSMAIESLRIIPLREYQIFRTTRIVGRNNPGREENTRETDSEGGGKYDSEDVDAEKDAEEEEDSFIRMSGSESDDLYM